MVCEIANNYFVINMKTSEEELNNLCECIDSIYASVVKKADITLLRKINPLMELKNSLTLAMSN